MRKRIGDYLIDKNVLTKEDVKKILKYSKSVGLRFGEAGMELGILDKEALLKLFGPNFGVDFFHLDAEFFPESTRDLFTPDFMIKNGVIPLGFKTEYKLFRAKKLLNLGFLNPSEREHVRSIEGEAMSRLNDPSIIGVKNFLVLGDQMLDVLQEVYNITDQQIRQMPSSAVNDTLAMFLGSDS